MRGLAGAMVVVRCGGRFRGRQCSSYVGSIRYERALDGIVFWCCLPVGSDAPWVQAKREGKDILFPYLKWYEHPFAIDDHAPPDVAPMPDQLVAACYDERHTSLLLTRADLERALGKYRDGKSGKPELVFASHHPR